MAFLTSGLPLHTRAISIEVREESASALRVEGTILDLRKGGALPLGGELQTAGIIHQMHWRCSVEEPSGRIARLEVGQPVVAMERSPGTGGECCRDPAPRLQALVGSAFDAGFPKRLAGIFGGALGCSHLLTLGQAIGSLLPRVLARNRRPRGAPGERVAKQVLFLDGLEQSDESIEVAIQLAEYQLLPPAAAREPADGIASAFEVRLRAEVALAGLRLDSLGAETRERAAGAPGDWQSLDAALAPLVGGPALRGLAPRVFACVSALAEGPRRALATEALLNLAPGLIQCMAALSHRLAPGARAAPSRGADPAAQALLTSGGFPDSCYMWRSGGAMDRMRRPPS